MDGNIASLAQGQFASPGLQYSTYPYQVPDGHGAFAAYYAANQQLAPQSWFANPLAQGIQPIGSAFGVPFGIPQIGSTLGGFGNQFSGFFPVAVTPQAAQAAQVVAQQAAQAGQLVANQAAQQAGQQTALAGQQVAQQAAQQAGQQAAIVAQQVALQAAQQAGFQATIVSQQVAQQAAQQAAHVACQVAHQVAQQAAQQIATGSAGPLMYHPMNVLGAPYLTPQQLAAQSWFGNILGQQPRPIGLATGGIYGYPQFGYPQFGNPLGVLPGQAPWSVMPFQTFSQTANQGGFGNWIGTPSGAFGVLQPGIAPLNPYAAPIGSQTQLTATPRFSFA